MQGYADYFTLKTFQQMNARFKLVVSMTKEVIGFEYLTIDGWKNDVFDFGERDGSFDHRELGDGFLGNVHRCHSSGLKDKGGNGEEVFEGDVFEVIFKDCPDGYSILGKETKVLRITATTVFKWGKFMIELLHPETKKMVYKDLCDFLENEQKVVVGNIYESIAIPA